MTSDNKKGYDQVELRNHVLGGLMGTAPPSNIFSHNDFVGLVADNSSQMFALIQALINIDGDLDEETWFNATRHEDIVKTFDELRTGFLPVLWKVRAAIAESPAQQWA